MAKIFVSFTIVSTAHFFLVAREKDNPLAEVYRSDVLLPPHTQRNITIDDLNPVMHSVELWTTVDDVNLNQLRGRCDIDASQYTQVAFDDIYFIVDRGLPLDPVSGQGQYDNPDLAGKQYKVFMPGFGPLIEGIHIERNTDVNNVDIGGFHFINGQVFLHEAEYTIMIANLTTQQVPAGGNNSGYPNAIVSVIGNIDLAQPHYTNLLEVISQNNNNITITIPDIATIPENTKFGINTHNFNYDHGYRYTILQLPTGTYTLINGIVRNTVYIARGENVSFMKQGSYLRIINDWVGPKTVGTKVYADGLSPVNGLPILGGWYTIAQYPRLFYWYVNALPPGELGTGYTDDQNPDMLTRLRWIIGVNKFWVPDHGNAFYRNSYSGRGVNTFEDNALQPANINTRAFTGVGIGKNSIPTGNPGVGVLATFGDGGAIDTNGSSGTNRTTHTDPWELITGSSETRPKNVAQTLYVLY
jgi:hypothetical protein